MSQVKVAVVGYGNVGRGVIASLRNNTDLVLSCVVSRSPERVKKEFSAAPVFHISEAEAAFKATGTGIAILCGGSKDDLPKFGPQMAKLINTVDSFDNHSRIPEYFGLMDGTAKAAGHVSVISTGWDPGIFSLERTLAGAFIPGCRAYGFDGLGPAGGLSMGHSDALRTIPGVRDARQYTHAIPAAIKKVQNGENPKFEPGDMHTRECFVVLEEGADKVAVTKAIMEMPGYFAPYDTTVNFVTQEELNTKYAGFPHDGMVAAAGTTGKGNPARIEYRCAWGSNPEATANVLVAHARAAARLVREGRKGAFTILDIPASYFTTLSREELLAHWM